MRRGYFVAGLGAAQFALPGAIDRLRAARDLRGPGAGPDDEPIVPVVLAAADPAQPYGAVLAWPPSAGRPARVAGAFTVLLDGEPVVYLERGAHSLVTFPAASGAAAAHWADALTGLVKDGRLRKLEITKIDGAAPAESPVAEGLRAAGFVDGYKGLVFRT